MKASAGASRLWSPTTRREHTRFEYASNRPPLRHAHLLTTTRNVAQEGPNECALVLLRDKKTLWSVMRVDGGDGFPHGRTKPFLSSTSTVRDKAFIMISFTHY